MKESELRAPVEQHLASLGYTTWVAPDGRDYFDVVAARGEEVGLVELKVSAARQVFAQAIRRRAWADWVAVAIPGRHAALRLLARPSADRAQRIGVWVVRSGRVEVLRAAEPIVRPGETDPFPEARAQMRQLLREIRSGDRPDGADWGLFGAPRLPGRRARSTRDWRLEEFPEGAIPATAGGTPPRTAPPSDRS